MTDKNVCPTIFIKRMGKKGKPARGGQARRARRELRFTIYEYRELTADPQGKDAQRDRSRNIKLKC